MIPLLPDNQGDIYSLLDIKSRKMLSAAILMEPMLLLHRKGCILAPTHVKRNLNQWADELTHPDYEGFRQTRRLLVEPLLRNAHLLKFLSRALSTTLFLLLPHRWPEWCKLKPTVPAFTLTRSRHISATLCCFAPGTGTRALWAREPMAPIAQRTLSHCHLHTLPSCIGKR